MLKGLHSFLHFSLAEFLDGKRLVYVKATPWSDASTGEIIGSKVVVQIAEDHTSYSGTTPIDNFGEQLCIKVRNLTPASFSKLRPLATEIAIKEVEKAAIFGEFRNQISIIASIEVAKTTA